MRWVDDVVAASVRALTPLADAERAAAMQAYMKDVAPFLGVTAPDRRDALKAAWQPVGKPASTDELAVAVLQLVGMPEREYAYAAADLIGVHVKQCGTDFLNAPVEQLLLTIPWWDTVDLLGSAVVSPLCKRDPVGSRAAVLRWSNSGDRWLVRAAIQHQRGWRKAADVEFVLAICSDHAGDPEFFVQKAIGWALRDFARVDARAVAAFVAAHPQLTRVATREADKGLERIHSR